MESLLPCNEKLLTLWKANPSHPILKAQVEKELRLERQKIRVVLQFLLIKNVLTTAQSKAYRERLAKIDSLLKTTTTTSCCVHGHGDGDGDDGNAITTCDLTAEAGERYVRGGTKALDKWVKESLKKVRACQRKWRNHCKSKPMTSVNWSSKDEAYARISEWAVAECLDLQKKDLKGIKI